MKCQIDKIERHPRKMTTWIKFKNWITIKKKNYNLHFFPQIFKSGKRRRWRRRRQGVNGFRKKLSSLRKTKKKWSFQDFFFCSAFLGARLKGRPRCRSRRSKRWPSFWPSPAWRGPPSPARSSGTSISKKTTTSTSCRLLWTENHYRSDHWFIFSGKLLFCNKT